MADPMTPSEAIGTVSSALTALPACIAGSAVSAETYGLPFGQFSDVDVFCYSEFALSSGAQRLLAAGFEVEDIHARVYQRWLRYGLSSWHTNSLKLMRGDLECNLIYKTAARKPLTSLSQVLESFDFGLLGTGYDLERGTKQDLRGYMFPGWDIDGPLPLMPERRDNWRQGFISQYQGLRELGRYAKYFRRGYDMSEVQADLVEGYLNAGTYLATRDSQEKQWLSQIYLTAADKLMTNDIDDLEAAGKVMVEKTTLDLILEELE